jgi:Tfp pilus assembly protein PilF
MDKHFQRGQVLLGQGRFDLAADEFRQALAADPDSGLLHAVLALCLHHQDREEEATAEARRAIALAPDLDLGHSVLARALLARDRPDEAEVAVREAIRLDPEDPNHFGVLALIRHERRDWQGALDAAEQGLSLDPQNVVCNNVRGMALVKLGRHAEAGATLESALAADPENAFTHANQGWALLNRGEPHKAMEHFREALRLEPGMDYARAGIVEAMKSRHLIYRVMLAYFLWTSRLSRGAQWGLILGFFFGQRLLRWVAEANPAWKPWVTALLVLAIAFAVLTWIASPLFNLLLLLDRVGRRALTRKDRVAAVCVGACLVPALAGLVAWLVTDDALAFLGMIYFGLLLLPLAALFRCAAGWPRAVMVLYTVALAVMGPASLVLMAFDKGAGSLLLTAFLWGSFLSGFAANFLMMARPRR